MNKEKEKEIFEYLREYYQDKFNNFFQAEKNDSPDFKNLNDSIGVEITEAITEESAKKKSFFYKVLECKNKKEVDNHSDGVYKGQYKNNVIYNDEGIPLGAWDVGDNNSEYPYCEDLIYKAISKKLKKLNKPNLYQIFNTNVLLIFCNAVFLGGEYTDIEYIQNNIVKNIKEIEKRYDRNFDEYLFLRLTNPVRLFIVDKEYKVTLHLINDK